METRRETESRRTGSPFLSLTPVRVPWHRPWQGRAGAPATITASRTRTYFSLVMSLLTRAMRKTLLSATYGESATEFNARSGRP